MRIYFSGIGGVGIGPLALIAKDMGHEVLGSDLNDSRYINLIKAHGIEVFIGQTGQEIAQAHKDKPIGWVVVTSALPDSHPELKFAHEQGIRVSKRDELLNALIEEKGLRLLAIAGTHGKTTTTGMLIWLLKELGEPVSYSIGTNISFGPSGQYLENSQYFVYEADEYDRNFLHFKPYSSIIPSIDYDHSDTYPDRKDYITAFYAFIGQSHCAYMWSKDVDYIGDLPIGCMHAFGSHEDVSDIKLIGEQNRRNAYLVVQAVKEMFPTKSAAELKLIISRFPGTERRFEKLIENLYTDYAHHPTEIAASIEMASEVSRRVVVVYQPHQNIRQHEIKNLYKDCFKGAQKVYWLPTYQSREDPKLEILTPEQLITEMNNTAIAETAELDDDLKNNIKAHLNEGQLVLLMSAGDLDQWARDNFTSSK
jgi:UDP-N-acetylmuramate--alanine ligase